METDSDDYDPDYILPGEYEFIPIRALRMSARTKLAMYLDLEGTLVVCGDTDLVNNYNGLAELVGFEYLEIRNIKNRKSPTDELLDLWSTKEHACVNATVGNLWQFLHQMERFDVLKNCRRVIVSDCKRYVQIKEVERHAELYSIEQDPTVSTSCPDMQVDEFKYVTIGDVKNDGQPQTYYDAFICYTCEDESDREFVREMIKVLEQQHNLKLFVPGRDDLPGSSMHTVSAYLIEERCRRVVILLSNAFRKSAACEFQMKFAQALAPGARCKKLIPVIRERKTPVPRILKFLALCDFSKTDMKDWVWDRLHTAIIAPIPMLPNVDEDTSDVTPTDLHSLSFPTVPKLFDDSSSSSLAGAIGGEELPLPSGEISTGSHACRNRSGSSRSMTCPGSNSSVSVDGRVSGIKAVKQKIETLYKRTPTKPTNNKKASTETISRANISAKDSRNFPSMVMQGERRSAGACGGSDTSSLGTMPLSSGRQPVESVDTSHGRSRKPAIPPKPQPRVPSEHHMSMNSESMRSVQSVDLVTRI